eukprot:COSAG01_NODE_346_length_18524_cov_35.929661_6_plen_222_part_00
MPEGLCCWCPKDFGRWCPKDFGRWCPRDFGRWCPKACVLGCPKDFVRWCPRDFVPEGLCAVAPEGRCFGVPEGLCSVVPEGLCSVVPEGLCAGWLGCGVCVGVYECMLGFGLAICGVVLALLRFPAGPHSRATAPVSPVVVPAGSVGGRVAGGAWRGWVVVCRYELCGELWCRLVQAGLWKGGGRIGCAPKALRPPFPGCPTCRRSVARPRSLSPYQFSRP